MPGFFQPNCQPVTSEKKTCLRELLLTICHRSEIKEQRRCFVNWFRIQSAIVGENEGRTLLLGQTGSLGNTASFLLGTTQTVLRG
jgi:hypothetical protein